MKLMDILLVLINRGYCSVNIRYTDLRSSYKSSTERGVIIDIMEKINLSVVMPAYNEGDKIYTNAIKVSQVISDFEEAYEIVVVNDGSTDNTKKETLRASETDSHIRLVSYKKNGGKGKAIHQGVNAALGKYIAFLDADLDLPPEQLKGYVEALEKDEADVVIGSKMHKESRLDYPWIRKVMSLGYYCLLRLLFHMKIKDTQTGIKVFKAETIKPVISLVKTKGFAYDIEILAAVNRRGYRIKEMPVELVFTRGNGMGRIHISDILKMFCDTFKIFGRLVFKKYYDL